MQAAGGTALTDPATGSPPSYSTGQAPPSQPPPSCPPALPGQPSPNEARATGSGDTGRRIGVLFAVAAVVLAADLATKTLVVATLSDRAPIRLLGGALLLRSARNSGAAFGIAQGATVVFTLVAVAVIAVIARTARRLRSLGWAVALGLLLGGAVGNLVDRLFRAPAPLRGAVLDWIDVRVWPVFNLADSAIVVGGILAVILSLRGVAVDGDRPGRHEDGSGAGPYSTGE